MIDLIDRRAFTFSWRMNSAVIIAKHDFLQDLNPDSMRVVRAQLEPSLAGAAAGETFQFERHGYFTADPGGGFNRTVTLRDSWSK